MIPFNIEELNCDLKAKNSNSNPDPNLIEDKDNRVKTFLKVREKIGDKPYYVINNEKNLFTLHDSLRKVETDKSVKLELDKIFTNEENSYIYEEVCREAINETLKSNMNYCFVGIGPAKSGKKNSLVGSKDSLDNINNRGLLFRFTEKLFESPDLQSLSYQFFLVYSNKYVDLAPLCNLSKNEISTFKQEDLVSRFSELQPTKEVSNEIKTIKNFNHNEFINQVLTIMGMIHNLEEEALHLHTRSHFILSLGIKNQSNVKTRATFICLAGSQNITDNPKINIYIKNQIDALAVVIKNLQLNYQGPDNSTIFDESRLTRYLKDYIQSNCKFRILGCVVPGPGYYQSVVYQNVLNVLLYLLKCKRPLFEESKGTKKLKRDDSESVIVLNEQIKVHERNQIKNKQEIVNLRKQIEEIELKHNQELQKIKENFGFEGDIHKVAIITDEITQEKLSAEKIKDALSKNIYLTKRYQEAEKRNLDLVKENKKVINEAKSMLGDRSLVAIYTKMKEDNNNEERKLKVITESHQETFLLQNKCDQLTAQAEAYKKEIANLNKKFQNLPSLLKENFKDKEAIKNLVKENQKTNVKSQFKIDLESLNENHFRELNLLKRKYEGELMSKKIEIEKLRDEIIKINEKEQEINKQYKDELLKIYEILKTINVNFKNTFKDDKNKLSTLALSSLIKAKEQHENYIEKSESCLVAKNFPYLFKILEEKRFLFSKASNISPVNNNYLLEENKEVIKDDKAYRKSTRNNFINPNAILNTEPTHMNIVDTLSTIPKDKSKDKSNSQFNMNIPTTSVNKTKKEESLSVSDISMEMENLKKPFNLKQIEYDVTEPERYLSRDLIPVINEYRKRFAEYDDLLSKIVKDKRQNTTYMKDRFNNVNPNLTEENEKLNKMLENYRKMLQQNKMTIESQERMLEKYTGNAAYAKLNESARSNKYGISTKNNPTNPTLNTNQTNVTSARTNSSFQSPQRSNLSRPATGKRPTTSFRK